MRHLNIWHLATRVILLALVYPAFSVCACEIRTDSIPVAEAKISYSHAGQGPRVMLIHGLFAQKEQWHDVLCKLADLGYAVTAPDLPGYGQSQGFDLTAYQLERQADLLHQFAQQIQLAPFHIAGNSMGGAVSAFYARSYPQEIRSLTFIGGTLGVGAWAKPLKQGIFAGFNPFIPMTTEQFDYELSLLMVKPPFLDDAAKQAAIQPYITNNQHYRQVWDIVNLYADSLLHQPRQSLPVLILWGEDDHVFDVSGMPKLAQAYRQHQSVALRGAGHLAMIDAPSEVTRHYHVFLKNVDALSDSPMQHK